jgi:hypothetical protein
VEPGIFGEFKARLGCETWSQKTPQPPHTKKKPRTKITLPSKKKPKTDQ